MSLAMLSAALVATCDDQAPTAPTVRVDSSLVASADVAPRLDPSRTYEYDFSQVNPGSVLLDLWRAGLPLSEAWLPVNYLCEDARGPRLTVELTTSDDRMAGHGFQLGTGRLQCSQDLWRYLVVPATGGFAIDAVVRFVDLEGGCWLLDGGDSSRYEPVGLAAEFRVDGLAVRVTLRHRPDLVSLCAIAPLVEVVAIERR